MPRYKIRLESQNGEKYIHTGYYGGNDISLGDVAGGLYYKYVGKPDLLVRKLISITDEEIVSYVERMFDGSILEKERIIEELKRNRDELREWIERNPNWKVKDYRF